jgi:hypothetical protein
MYSCETCGREARNKVCKNCQLKARAQVIGAMEFSPAEYQVVWDLFKGTCQDCGLEDYRCVFITDKYRFRPKGSLAEKLIWMNTHSKEDMMCLCGECLLKGKAGPGRPKLPGNDYLEGKAGQRLARMMWDSKVKAHVLSLYGSKCTLCEESAARVLWAGLYGQAPKGGKYNKVYSGIKLYIMLKNVPELREGYLPFCQNHRPLR